MFLQVSGPKIFSQFLVPVDVHQNYKGNKGINLNIGRQKLILYEFYVLMKKSEQITSPASFLKKQSHIITNNGMGQEYQTSSNTRYDLDMKEMHRSHFHSQANSTKLIDDDYFDQHEMLEKYSEGKDKAEQFARVGKGDRQQFQSFYQSDELSSDQDNSQKNQKKFILGANTLSEKVIKRVSSSNFSQEKFLYINSKKQKHNNNYLFLGGVEALKEEIKKYEVSIDKLKKENSQLILEKAERSRQPFNNQSMQLIELRMELDSFHKKIKQLEREKEMHLTINHQKDEKIANNVGGVYNHMAASCLETPSKNSEREQPKRSIPTFRIVPDKEIQSQEALKVPNSPRIKVAKPENPTQNYKILQNMKSPYFLKKN